MTNLEAHKRGAALLKKLKGKGWRVRVWENIGWHYAAHLGPSEQGCLSLHPHSDGSAKYAVLLGAAGAGNYQWYVRKRYRDPNTAVRAQMRAVKAYLDRWQGHVEALAEALKS